MSLCGLFLLSTYDYNLCSVAVICILYTHGMNMYVYTHISYTYISICPYDKDQYLMNQK